MNKEVSETSGETENEIALLSGRILSLKPGGPGKELGKLQLELYKLLVGANRVSEGEKSLLDAVSSFESAGENETLSEFSFALHRLGILFRNKSRHTEAGSFLDRAYNAYLKAGATENACSVLNDAAINLQMKGEIKNALLTYRRGLTISRQFRYNLLQMKFVFNTSVLFSRYPSLHKEALRYNEEAAYLCRKLDDFRGLGYVLTNTAFLLDNAGSRKQAEENAREAFVLREKHGTYYEKGFACLNLAGYLDISEAQEEKEKLYIKAREIMHEAMFADREIDSLLGLIQIELYRNNIEKARAYFVAAEEIGSSVENDDAIRHKLLEAKYDLEKASGNWNAALSALEQVENRRNSRNKEVISKELKAVCAKWDVDLINVENTLLQARNNELRELNRKLSRSLEKVRRLSGLLPMCSSCGKVKDDEGYWQQLDDYVSTHYMNRISHSLCEECRVILYPQTLEHEVSERQ